MTSGWETDKRMEDGESPNPLIRFAKQSADHLRRILNCDGCGYKPLRLRQVGVGSRFGLGVLFGTPWWRSATPGRVEVRFGVG
jgi:hypothetical protein